MYRNIDDVDKTMDEINEQTENMKQIQEALSTPIGTAADIDEVLSDLSLFISNFWCFVDDESIFLSF
jgi:charged multivesicular body protein 4